MYEKIKKLKKLKKKLSKSCQKVVKKLAKSWQKVGKKLVKILKRVGEEEEEEEGEEGDLFVAPRPGTTMSHLVKTTLPTVNPNLASHSIIIPERQLLKLPL
jgi:hypothetical protein